MRGVRALAFAEEFSRVGVFPSDAVPVVHMLAEHDQLCPGNWLGLIELLEKAIGRRTTGATFRGE